MNSARKTRLQLLLCKTSIDIFEKTLLTLFWKCTYELSRSRFTPQFAIFAEPLRKRKANVERRSFRVRGSNVEASGQSSFPVLFYVEVCRTFFTKVK